MLRLALAVATLLVLLAFPAAALANHNDDFGVAVNGETDLTLNETDFSTNAGFSEEPGEPLDCFGVSYHSTAWYRVIAEVDGDITVTTFGSDIDTVLAIYGPHVGDDAPFVDCQDDNPAAGDGSSEVTFTAVEDEIYYVQVGSCCGSPQGDFAVTALGDTTTGGGSPPSNDNRAAAETIALGQTLLRSNLDATTENEPLTCNGVAFGATVWFRVNVPATGDAVITASSTSMDPVVAVYPAGSNAQITCNDDAPGQSLSSRAPARLGPGAYDIQVGALGDSGLFEIQVTFSEDTDLDDDGSARGQDCNDGDGSIRPGAPEVLNNDVDENCDNVKEFDRDGDGSRVPGNPGDCDDGNPARSPLKQEVKGNAVDENCDNDATPYDLIPSRVVSAWDWAGRTTKMTGLTLNNARRGSTVTIICRRKGCRFRQKAIRITRNAKQMELHRKLKKRQRAFGLKSRLTVRLSGPGWSPKETVYRFRRGKVPVRQELCYDDRREC